MVRGGTKGYISTFWKVYWYHGVPNQLSLLFFLELIHIPHISVRTEYTSPPTVRTLVLMELWGYKNVIMKVVMNL